MTILFGLLIMAICSFVIAKACDNFEAASDYLGRNLSEGVKGATINAIASSMPELLTTVFFLAFATTEKLGYNLAASIAGDAGSAIFNSIIIPMFVILIVIRMGISAGASVSKKVILRDGLTLIGAEVLLLVLLSTDVITYKHGLILVIFYFCYLGYTLWSMKKNQKKAAKAGKSEIMNVDIIGDIEGLEEEYEDVYKYAKKLNGGAKIGDDTIDKNMKRSAWGMLVIATLIISAACAGLVHGTELIAEALQINMMFVALLLVAAASSVPDTIISMRDAKKGNHDDALANVWGSNIFDITISMGGPLAAYLLITGQVIDFTAASASLVDLRLMLLAVTILTVGVFYFSKNMGKKQIWMLGFLYALFVVYCVGGAYPETMVGEVITSIKAVLHANVEPFLYKVNGLIPFI